MNENIDVKVTVEFTIKDCIDRETLSRYYTGIEHWVDILITEEGWQGVVEDEYTIVKVEEL